MQKNPILNFKINLSNRYDMIDSVIYQNLMDTNIEEFIIFPDSSILTKSQCNKISKKINIETFFDYSSKYFSNSFITNEISPYMIVMCDGNFTNLDNILYDDSTVDYLNQMGLNIYFWEALVISYDS
jgi:hypothetical protein